MKYEELLILLPCHSLEDFPVYHEGDEAQGLLANWTAMWRPELLASAEATPTWGRVDSPPANLQNRLIMVPAVGANDLPTGFAQRAKEEGATLIRRKHDRKEIVAEALAPLRGDALAPLHGDSPAAEPDAAFEDLAGDFLALGYCYLQVQLLTRQMRYASNLDEIHFRNQALAAARAAVSGDLETARQKLAGCFDVLAEERNHYYPVEAYTIDLVLTAATTLGATLEAELASPAPLSLLISGEHLKELAAKKPQLLEKLKEAVAGGAVSTIGGDEAEARLPLLASESLLRELRSGLAEFERDLGSRPKVYGRRRSGLTPMLPQLLHKLGFIGALHATCDDGKFPEGSQIKTRWEGAGGAIDAIARAPLDAARPETYLRLAQKLGESMDVDHVATICLAHWPKGASPWHDDLRRISRYTSALGKFVTLDQYFTDSQAAGPLDRFTAGQYRSPYLKQAVIRKRVDPISSSIRYWRRAAKFAARQRLAALGDLVAGRASEIEKQGALAELAAIDFEAEGFENLEQAGAANSESLDRALDESLAAAGARFAERLPKRAGAPAAGVLLVNPHSFVRRVGVSAPKFDRLPTIERPIYSASTADTTTQIVADVPPLGFLWVASGNATTKNKRPPKPLAEDGILRNEYFEALINPTTGALQSLHEYDSRRNRMSQQLAFRMGPGRRRPGSEGADPDELAEYSVMAADRVEVTQATETVGEIVARGRLLDLEGRRLAGYRQTYRLWRGGRVLWIETELDPEKEPAADPWESYYCSRFAWADESAELMRAINQTRQPLAGKRFEAPQYIDIEAGEAKTTILTGGLPFHRRVGFRIIDSLLIVKGERERNFTLGIGIDLPHAQHEAEAMLAPPLCLPQTSPGPSPANSSWLMHLDAKNVMLTWLEPLSADNDAAKIAGFRARLLETAGRAAKLKVSCFRAAKSARRLDFLGQPQGECEAREGGVFLELTAHEFTEIEVWF